MKYQLKRIDTWSVVKITFLIAGVVGFVVGALYAVLITIMASYIGMIGIAQDMPDEMAAFLGATGLFAVIAWILITILYAVLAALVVSLATWLYNLLAGAIGGVTVTLEALPSVIPAATPAPADAAPPASDATTATVDAGGPDPQST